MYGLYLLYFSLISSFSSVLRSVCCRGSENQSSIAVALKDTIKLRAEFPDYMVGFDIVGQEDSGPPLIYFIEKLLIPSQTGVDLPYFFHAGETSK